MPSGVCHPKNGLELFTQTMPQPGPTYTGAAENVGLAKEADTLYIYIHTYIASKGHSASEQGMGTSSLFQSPHDLMTKEDP